MFQDINIDNLTRFYFPINAFSLFFRQSHGFFFLDITHFSTCLAFNGQNWGGAFLAFYKFKYSTSPLELRGRLSCVSICRDACSLSLWPISSSNGMLGHSWANWSYSPHLKHLSWCLLVPTLELDLDLDLSLSSDKVLALWCRFLILLN